MTAMAGLSAFGAVVKKLGLEDAITDHPILKYASIEHAYMIRLGPSPDKGTYFPSDGNSRLQQLVFRKNFQKKFHYQKKMIVLNCPFYVFIFLNLLSPD